MHTIRLQKGREDSIRRKHPWIFSRAIQSGHENLQDGDSVLVEDFKGQVLGTGHYQNSSLAVRIIAFEKIVPDFSFWKTRLEAALQYRLSLGLYMPGQTDAFRLVHGEGDQLPGLIVDIYGPVAVVQAHSIGMYKALPEIARVLTTLPVISIQAVYSKSKDALPSNYAHRITDHWMHGNPPEELVIHEGGIRFVVDPETGQKTGFFLDQRDNRALVKRYAHGKDVLNGFSYTGGFSLYALQGGANHVISVDTSAGALAGAERNVDLNKFGGGHQVVKENVMTFLTTRQDLFDVVIVDPPAFAKSLSKRHNAIQAYKRLNVLAMARVKPGGLLFTFSCSQVVDRPLFHHTIVAAAIEAGRMARVVHDLGQGADHPVSVFHPEGQYLKGLVLCLE